MHEYKKTRDERVEDPVENLAYDNAITLTTSLVNSIPEEFHGRSIRGLIKLLDTFAEIQPRYDGPPQELFDSILKAWQRT